MKYTREYAINEQQLTEGHHLIRFRNDCHKFLKIHYCTHQTCKKFH